jgi:hypothetical protein
MEQVICADRDTRRKGVIERFRIHKDQGIKALESEPLSAVLKEKLTRTYEQNYNHMLRDVLREAQRPTPMSTTRFNPKG